MQTNIAVQSASPAPNHTLACVYVGRTDFDMHDAILMCDPFAMGTVATHDDYRASQAMAVRTVVAAVPSHRWARTSAYLAAEERVAIEASAALTRLECAPEAPPVGVLTDLATLTSASACRTAERAWEALQRATAARLAGNLRSARAWLDAARGYTAEAERMEANVTRDVVIELR